MPRVNHLAKLYDLAEGQAGYFTTAQAEAAGVDRRRLAYFAHVNRIQRIHHGVYRLTQFPHSRHEDLVIAWLTTGPDSVISHESALLLYELSDVLPETIHVTVPRPAAHRRPDLRLHLHTNQIGPADITHYEGLPVTTVPRTIADVALAGLSDEFVMQAVREAVRSGLVAPDRLLAEAAPRSQRLVQVLRRALAEAAQP
jgi:predicted transcriptional regulator of viral defense system